MSVLTYPEAIVTPETGAQIQLPIIQQSRPTLSIIIPFYQNLAALIRAIHSLQNTVTWERTEVLVQDDASPDVNLMEVMAQTSLPVKVQRNERNLGFSGNCNAGVARARGEYICLFNQDLRAITPGWADAMLDVFYERPNVGIVGPKLIFPPERGGPAIQSCGGLFDAGKGPYHRYLGWRQIKDARVNTTERVSWITGACLMTPRELYLKDGGLDGIAYPGGYFEDADYCMRVRIKYHKDVWYCPQAELFHDVGSSGGGNPKFMQNSVRFHNRWDRFIEPDSGMVFVGY